jgi:SanA protein
VLKKYYKIFLLVIIFIISLIICIDFWVSKDVKNQLYNNIQSTPYNRVGLLLGTSKFAKGGKQNLFYKYRINAAVALYKSGKIDFILVSGDNSDETYNEPKQMRKDLIKQGIPSIKIVLDYAGFRTLDSVIRAKEVFGVNEVTIISQQFHNERAVYLANRRNLKAIAFNAQQVSFSYSKTVFFREKFARVKLIWDILINKQPKFLGEKIKIQ